MEPLEAGRVSAPRSESHSVSMAASPAEPPSPFVAPSISLPKGGGAIRGIGEKFAANPVTGTGSMIVPIVTSPGRANFGPQLSLSYDSGSGNGPFGFGWTLGLPTITRKTDKGLPRYRDAEESDVFLLSGAEDLVPELEADGQRFEHQAGVPGYTVHRYRPRIEAAFARIERWTRQTDGDVHWRTLSRDNVLTLYGRDANSRIADPADPRRVFSWLISETRDDRGNAILYDYKPEDGAAVDVSQSCERNRGDHDSPLRTAQRHIKRIRYGNRFPLLDDNGGRPSFLPTATLADAAWLFEVVFDYGEHDTDVPRPGDGGIWPCRNDPFSSCRPGFELRTYRLCRRVLMFHHFPEEAGVGTDCLVRSTDFAYREDNPVASFLTSVSLTSYRRSDTGYLRKSLPPNDFGYSPAVVGKQIHDVEVDSLDNLPDGVVGAANQWLDLDGEGLTGVLTEQAAGWFYKRNESILTRDTATDAQSARLAAVDRIERQPMDSMPPSGRRQFLDLAGDGQLDLVTLAPPVAGYHERHDEHGWSPFRAFESMPNVAWNDPGLRFVDLTGDGHADILLTETHALTWHPSLAETGFGPPQAVETAADEERGPRVVFADGTETILLADMSGDGLSDIVRTRNGEVCYWPNLGYGRFGAKVAMDDAPWFDTPDQFDPRRLRLADIDGSGVTDIIYLGRDRIRFWYNLSGNKWSGAHEIAAFPAVDNVAAVAAVDLLGDGTACLVWSSPLKGSGRSPMKYLPLMAEGKPHLLTSTHNNLGAETRVHYAPSTYFYLKDKRDGRPWVTRLPFPVHVVECVETLDSISRNRFVTRYAYHHGYFDGTEREFRGFGMVEQFDTEEFAALSASSALPEVVNIDAASHVPPVLTRTWFHTGTFIDGQKIERLYARAYFHDEDVPPLPDTLLPTTLKSRDGTEQPWRLTTDEVRQACRALKGVMLRQEVYARDGSVAEGLPYRVTENNYTIELLQPSGPSRHAVFFTHAREAITFHYERKLYDVGETKRTDPRITHAVTLATDGYGNTLQGATIGYGRRLEADDPLLSAEDRQKQSTTLIAYTQADYTNAVDDGASYHSPLPAEARNYEIIRVAPDPPHTLFRFDALQLALQRAGDGGHDLPYEDIAASGAIQDHPYRRLIEHTRTLYRRDDLTGPLPLFELESYALPFESYMKAFTPGLAHATYVASGKLTEAELDAAIAEGGYVRVEGDAGWWTPSGRVFFDPEPGATAAQELALARQHFFRPRRFRDPFHNEARVRYDRYDLLELETEDALRNKVTAGERGGTGAIEPRIDYRLLQPALTTDPNGNRTAASFDVLGLIAGTAVMGKAGEALGDSLQDFEPDLSQAQIDAFFADPRGQAAALLGGATTRSVYDVDRYRRIGDAARPGFVASLAREQHVSDLAPGVISPVQVTMGYSDGFGREIQKKIQAEPGPVADGGPTVTPRWVGSGWTVFNNKAKPVRQYEPFFSDSHDFEFARIVGISPILCYDPLERVVATLYPDFTWEKVVFDPWRQVTWEASDTVLVGDPRTDADVGAFFRQLPEAEFLPTWHNRRVGGGLGPQEQAAARKAAVHANTPTVSYPDSLGRTVLTIAHNRYKYTDSPEGDAPIEEFYPTRVMLDIEGNQREVADAKGRAVMRFSYDMLGGRGYQASMEAGKRWTLNDVSGKEIRGWDSRGHSFRTEFDALRRPISRFVAGSDPVQSDPRTLGRLVLFEKTAYGEDLPDADALNLRGRVFRLCDGAGFVTNHGHDFKGNLLSSSRTLAQDYKDIPNWADTPAVGETYSSSTTFDALNRPVTQTMPDSSVVRHSFNDAGLLESVDVNLRGEHAGGLALWTSFVTDIDYDAKGQRVRVGYGNGAETRYRYDPETFRLRHLFSRRDASFSADCGGDPPPPFAAPEIPPAGQRCGVQNLHYTYDAAGNVVHIRDDAQQTIFFNGQVVVPRNDFRYDAIARLIEATGREHRGQSGRAQTSWNDASWVGLEHPHDGQAMRNYAEQYEYDAVGNVTRLVHRAEDGNWTRRHEYDEESLLETGQVSNRLSRSIVGDQVEAFAYDAHGSVVSMPHLAQIGWDFMGQLYQADLGGGGTAYYVYDGAGQRVRKVIERQSGTRQKERIYLSGFEVYREYDGGTDAVALERETLHVSDDKRRIALVESRLSDNEGSAERIVRFQLGDHLESASLELDDAGRLISYEEYHPYGTTSYQAARSGLDVASKRYRYTNRERDEESGFSYHGARYYAPWVGRWISPDPAGLIDGSNLYRYARSNPIRFSDTGGMAPKSPEQIAVDELSDKKQFLAGRARHLEDEIAGNHALAHDLEQTVKDNPVVKKDAKKYDEIKKGIRDAKASVAKLEDQLGKVRGELRDVEKKLSDAVDKLAELVDPLSVQNELDEFDKKLNDLNKPADSLNDIIRDSMTPEEKKRLEELEKEVDDELKKRADDAGTHADDADKLLRKGGKEVLEEGSEKGLKRVAKWVGRKLGSILPFGGAVASVALAPDDQHPAETAVRAVASEIGIGPFDLEMAMDFGEACAEGAARRAEWEFKETVRLEKKGWKPYEIAWHVNRGAKW